MHFERIEMSNFACYHGEHALDLKCSDGKPVVVILGGTGYGKTSIFDAINWALYGTDYELDLIKRRQRKIIDYVNETSLREAEASGTHVQVSCTLSFEHHGVHYYITQELVVKPARNSEGFLGCTQTDRATALYEITPQGDHRRREYDSIFLDEILPNNVKDYFLFDGDRIYQLSNPGASQEVRDAIYRVVDLELIKKAVVHLSDVATEYRRTANRESTGELSKVEEAYAKLRTKMAQLKEEEDNLKSEERALKAQLEAREEKLKNLPDTTELQGRRIELEKQLKRISVQVDETIAETRSLSAIAALSASQSAMLELTHELESRRQKGLIPRKVSQSLLADLLSMKRCLCGTEFQEGDEIFRILFTRLEAERTRVSDQGLLELLFQLQGALEHIEDSNAQLALKDQLLHDLSEQRREIDIAIRQIDGALDKLPRGDAASIASEVRQLRTDWGTIGRKLQRVSDNMIMCETQIKSLERKRIELSKQQEKVRSLQLREGLAQRAADRFDEIYEIFAEDSRRAVEELTQQEFQRFVQSASTYGVALSKDYELQVLDSNGNRALQRLSMGQSQCLSLSFITAISRVSEKNPPLVIDMPFGRLDREVHDQVSQRLPELTDQLILFLIPEVEWNVVTAKNLRSRSSHVYQLDFDRENRQAEITPLVI